ncbi:NAD-dependent succinate-semialdehyde dehydrogenase (plasmid) [Rhizobium sp. ACO-34A]|nr:NAD-dependent succinate-semialdehyde dehydrogenase [Rhizobium sp. ACO-34A]ATN36855.1 NAD-dependent succinate-semialdehyde dehydrogenase [Rhizobium sp. ACO-34A]
MTSFPQAQLILGGEERATGSQGTASVIDPATEEVLAVLPQAGEPEATEAARLAAQGFAEWSVMPAIERAKIMRRAAQLMRDGEQFAATTLTLEQGKPLAQALAEWRGSADLLDWYADEGRRAYGRLVPGRARGMTLAVHKRPVGPVAAFAPWNFPAWTVMQKVAPALAAGCSVVVKPSEETPATAWLIARALLEAGLPPKAISVIWGAPAAIASTLTAAPEIRKITLTGSVRVGRILAAEAGHHLKKVTMELGGHAPVIVARDCDPSKVAALAAEWKFRNAGQVCVSPTRFLIERPVYDGFVSSFAAAAMSIKVGAGLEEGVGMGPLATRNQFNSIMALVEDARAKGANVAAGGERVGNRGFFHQPTVLADMTPAMRAMNDEPFGPLALIMPVDSIDDALAEANRLPVGLASYAFTDSRKTSEKIAGGIKAGMLGLNHFALAIPETPFGGVKDSGFGSEGGIEGLDAFMMPFLVSAAV